MASTISRALLPADCGADRRWPGCRGARRWRIRLPARRRHGCRARRALPNLIEREGLAIGSADEIHLAAESFGEGFPALAEFSGGEDEHAISGRGEIGDGGFHGAGAGGGEQQHVVLSADKGLQLPQHALIERAELGGAVVDVRGGHGELGGGQQGGRAGRKKSGFTNHDDDSLAPILASGPGIPDPHIMGARTR